MFVEKRLELAIVAAAAGILVRLATNHFRSRNAGHREACRHVLDGKSASRDLLSGHIILWSLVSGMVILGAGVTIGNEFAHRCMSHLRPTTMCGVVAVACVSMAVAESKARGAMRKRRWLMTVDGMTTRAGVIFDGVSIACVSMCLGALLRHGGAVFSFLAGPATVMGIFATREVFIWLGWTMGCGEALRKMGLDCNSGESFLYSLARDWM